MSDEYLARSKRASLKGGGNSPQLTGRMVFFSLLGFFGVVFVVNGVMIHEALSTFGGLETKSSYKAGRMFEQEVAMAKAQDARQWHVEAKVTSSRGSTSTRAMRRVTR
jgi:nitrogen fixation protein FixH